MNQSLGGERQIKCGYAIGPNGKRFQRGIHMIMEATCLEEVKQ